MSETLLLISLISLILLGILVLCLVLHGLIISCDWVLDQGYRFHGFIMSTIRGKSKK